MGQPGYTNPEAQRGLGLQFLIASSFGLLSILIFSFSRWRWPRIYSARTMSNRSLPELRSSLFGWIYDVVKISDHDVLKFAGLDAYVYLMFFKAAVSLLKKLTIFYYLIIAPLRWWYLGQFDDPVDGQGHIPTESNGHNSPNLFGLYIWVYVASTYFFTAICLKTIREYTGRVVNTRQAYLGHQNSITDRTLRISGIPRKLRSEEALKNYLTILFSVAPQSIVLCHRWAELDKLSEKRKQLLTTLEQLYAGYIGVNNSALFQVVTGETYSDEPQPAPLIDDDDSMDPTSVWNGNASRSVRTTLEQLFPDKKRPVGKVESKEIEVDLIDYYSDKLAQLDSEIMEKRHPSRSPPETNMAFVTMESVAHCQLASQVVLSPLPHTMVSSLAPSPSDVVWQNVYLKPKERATYNYVITMIVLVTNAFLVIPLTYLARFLDLSIISRYFPNLGHWLEERHWMAAFVTDVLPTYVFASFNLFVPYVFSWLSKRQGFVSKSDIELSTVSKNFFYVFVNLFLIFTIESTLFSFSVDKFAKRFAHWLIRLSSFYTNLIVLQGIGLAPWKLLQLGDVIQFPFLAAGCKTARDCYELYKPHRMNYGLVLPNSMFIFIVVLTYSTLRGRILFFGLIYFAVSYVVYKYQLIYTMVHPQHSNAKLWTVITRRMYLGLGVFHVAVIGVLVLQSAYTLSLLILPLIVLLLGFWYDFENYTKPLLEFVAIEALHQSEMDFYDVGTYQQSQLHQQPPNHGSVPSENVSGSDSDDERVEGEAEGLWDNTALHETTIDELRENKLTYENHKLDAPLDGPWIATDGFRCVVANPEGLVVREIPQHEWI